VIENLESFRLKLFAKIVWVLVGEKNLRVIKVESGRRKLEMENFNLSGLGVTAL